MGTFMLVRETGVVVSGASAMRAPGPARAAVRVNPRVDPSPVLVGPSQVRTLLGRHVR
jgi:hypothetical protein